MTIVFRSRSPALRGTENRLPPTNLVFTNIWARVDWTNCYLLQKNFQIDKIIKFDGNKIEK